MAFESISEISSNTAVGSSSDMSPSPSATEKY
jgi:hypothetical protein